MLTLYKLDALSMVTTLCKNRPQASFPFKRIIFLTFEPPKKKEEGRPGNFYAVIVMYARHIHHQAPPTYSTHDVHTNGSVRVGEDVYSCVAEFFRCAEVLRQGMEFLCQLDCCFSYGEVPFEGSPSCVRETVQRATSKLECFWSSPVSAWSIGSYSVGHRRWKK